MLLDLLGGFENPVAATSPAAAMTQSPTDVAEPPARSAVPAIPAAPE